MKFFMFAERVMRGGGKRSCRSHDTGPAFNAGICFEPLEPRLLLSGSWGSAGDASSGDAQAGAAIAADVAAIESHAPNRNQAVEGLNSQVDVLAESSTLHAIEADAVTASTGSEIALAISVSAYAETQDSNPLEINLTTLEAIDDANANMTPAEGFVLAAEDAANEGIDVVLVDRALMDYQHFADAAKESAHIIHYDGEKESSEIVLGQAVEYATAVDQRINSLSIMSHGRNGAFKLGNTWIDAEKLNGRTEVWKTLDAVMNDGGNLYLFGCNVAWDDASGQALLDGLNKATQADVFASSDITGAGGDWELEAASTGAGGEISRGLAMPFDAEALAGYGHALVDYNEIGWSGSQTFTDGAISFTLEMVGGGTMDWSYDDATSTLTIGGTNATSAASNISITDNNGGLTVGNITVNSNLDTLSTNVAIGGTIAIDESIHIDNIISNSGAGNINTVHFNGFGAQNLGTVNIDASVNTLSTAGSIDLASGTDITVTGDVGAISGIDSFDNGAAITVNGDLGSLNVGWMWGGALSVGGDIGTITVANDFESSGMITIGGTATLLDFGGSMNGSVDITGDLVAMDVGWTWAGGLTVGGNTGTVTVANDFESAGTVDITGNATNLDFQGSLDGTVTVGGDAGTIASGWTGGGDVTIDGDLDSFTSSNDYTGTLTARDVSGVLTIVDDTFSDTTAYPAGTTVIYQGAINSLNAGFAPTALTSTATAYGGLRLNADGGNDTYLIADSGLATPLSQFTVEVQFEGGNASTEVPFISYSTGSGDIVAINTVSSNALELDIGTGSVGYSSAVNYNATLMDGQRHTLSVSWDNTAGDWAVYIDGTPVDSGTGLSTGQTIPAGGTLMFGLEQDSVGGSFESHEFFNGTLYDVRLFDDVRSAPEISANHQITIASSEPGLIANWTFNDLSTGGVVVDAVSANNLTVQHVGAGGGFFASLPELTLMVPENAPNGTVVGTITGIDPDAGDTLTYSLQDSAAGRFDIVPGTGVIRVADGSLLNYESNAGHTITVRVSDAMSNTYDEVFTIQVTDLDEPPLAVADSFTVDEGATDNLNLAANDSDPENSLDLASIAIVSGPTHGSIVVNGDGTVDYTHDGTANFSDAFSYTIDDNAGATSNAAAVSLTITPQNEAPVAVADSYTVNEDNTLIVNWWHTNWTRRQVLTFDNSGQTNSLTDFPVLVQLNSGNIDYAQTQDNGADLRFIASDGTPLAHEIVKWDESGNSYVWVKVPQITGGSNSDSIMMYYGNTLAPDAQDSEEVWSSDFAAVYHLENDLNDATANANHGSNSGSIDAGGQVGDGRLFDGIDDYGNLGSASSVDDIFDSGATISAWINPTGWGEGGFGRILDKADNLVTNRNGWAFELYGGNGSLLFQHGFTGAIGNWLSPANSINLGQWQHVAVVFDSSSDSNDPKLYINGIEQIVTELDTPSGTYRSDAGIDLTLGNYAQDTNRTFDGILDDVRISSTQRSADWIAAEHLSMTGAFVSFGSEETAPATGGLLNNDSDADGDLLSVTLVDGPDHAQSFTLLKDGTFSYTPTANYYGSDTFTYEVSDGNGGTTQATVNLTVNPVNDAPVNTVPATLTVDEETPTALAGISIDDIDAAGGDLTTRLQVSNGVLDVTLAGSAIISAGVNGSNDLTIMGNITDINATMMSLTYTGNPDVTGVAADTLIVRTSDGGNTGAGGVLQDIDNIQIDINPINDVPAITTIGDQTIAEDTPTGALGFTVGDVETVVGSLIVTATSSDTTLIPNGNLTLMDQGGGNWTIEATPAADQNGGPVTITVSVNDGTTTTDETFDVTVNPANDAPTITTIGDQTIAEDTPTGALGFTLGDVETAVDSLIVTATSSDTTLIPNGNLTLVDLGGGSWTIEAVPAANLSGGPVTITVTVDDGTTNIDETFNVTVTAANDAPVIGGVDSGAATEEVDPDNDGLLEASGILTIADPDPGESSFQAGSVVGTYGSLTINAVGNWTYAAVDSQSAIQQLDAGESLSDVLTVTAADGTTHNVTITIDGAEDAPSIGGTFAGRVEKDGNLAASGTLSITDADASDNPIGFADVAATPGDNGYGSFTLIGGVWTYALNNAHPAVQAMNAGDTLTDTHTFTATDGSIRVVTITIGVDASADVPPPTGGGDESDPDPDAGDDPIETQPDRDPGSDKVTSSEADETPPEAFDPSYGPSSKLTGITPPLASLPRYFVPTLSWASFDESAHSEDARPKVGWHPLSELKNELADRTRGLMQPVAAFFSSEIMNQELDRIQMQIDDYLKLETKQGRLIIGTATGIGASVFAGYVIWALRGSSLLFGAVSAMPMWRCFDPLPVLMGKNRKEDQEEQDKKGQPGTEDKDEKLIGDILGSGPRDDGSMAPAGGVS